MAACTFGANSCTPKLARLKPSAPDPVDHRIGERARIALDRDLGVGFEPEASRKARHHGTNAFVVPIDEEHRRYRYHPMFQELLRSQLRYRMPDAQCAAAPARRSLVRRPRPGLHGGPPCRGRGDVMVAAELVAEHWLSLLMQREAAQLSGWVDGLAPRVLAGSAELALAGAGAALALGELEQAQGYIELADAKARDVPAKRRARFALSRAIVAMLDARVRGDYEATRSAALKVLGSLQAAEPPAIHASLHSSASPSPSIGRGTPAAGPPSSKWPWKRRTATHASTSSSIAWLSWRCEGARRRASRGRPLRPRRAGAGPA